jgi:hypothetical protein
MSSAKAGAEEHKTVKTVAAQSPNRFPKSFLMVTPFSNTMDALTWPIGGKALFS